MTAAVYELFQPKGQTGRLFTGSSAAALSPFERYDHLLISIERGAPREDWRGLPALLVHEKAFNAVFADSELLIEEVKKKLAAAFRGFDTDLTKEDELTGPDKDRIRGEVAAELRYRVGKLEDPLFEASIEERSAVRRSDGSVADLNHFDFLAVDSKHLEGANPLPSGVSLF